MNFKVIFSSSKCIESLVIAMLIDKDLLKYEEKVAHYWPEFAQYGKSDIRLEDVLRHESGLARFNGVVHQPEDILRENIKKNSIGSVIEKCAPVFPNSDRSTGSKREYHAATRGFILNEIVRRVDPKKRYSFKCYNLTLHFKKEVQVYFHFIYKFLIS